MAPVTTSSPADDGLGPKMRKAARRNLKTNRATPHRQPQSHDLASDSESRLARPFSDRARHSITKQTRKLMQTRDRLNQELFQEYGTKIQGLPPKDKLPHRRELRRLAKVLVRREKLYISAMKRILGEKARLHRQDPSLERAIDLDLVKTQLQRFKRHLGPNLADRERPIESGEEDSEIKNSSTISDKRSVRQVRDARKQPDPEDTPESSTVDGSESNEGAEQEVAQTKAIEKEKDALKPHQGGLDGAFDDSSFPRSQSQKRKRGDEEKGPQKQAKKARKEQANEGKQRSSARTLEAQSTQSRPIKPAKSLKEKDAAINNMSQSKKGKVNSAAEKTGWSSIRVNGRWIQVPPPPFDLESDDEEPKYKKLSRAMQRPEYNDHVHHMPWREKSTPYKFPMSGALMDREDDLGRNGALITPPASDEADNTEGQARKKRAASKKQAPPQKRASSMEPRSNKLRKLRNTYHSSSSAPY